MRTGSGSLGGWHHKAHGRACRAACMQLKRQQDAKVEGPPVSQM